MSLIASEYGNQLKLALKYFHYVLSPLSTQCVVVGKLNLHTEKQTEITIRVGIIVDQYKLKQGKITINQSKTI